jgi:hypothetical protein
MDTGRTDVSLSARSGRSLTAEEKEAEKARLNIAINDFVRSSGKGCPCTFIREVTGERLTTRYFLTSTMSHLVINSSTDEDTSEVRCPISAIQDIYSFAEDGALCFPQKVLQLLSPEEQELLLMIVYRNEQGGNHRFCLLLETAPVRDTFLECVRILCIYMQTRSEPAEKPHGKKPKERGPGKRL